VTSQPNRRNGQDCPVIAVNDRGLTLGVDADGAWIIWDEDDTARLTHTAWRAHDRLMWLMPLLQKPQQVVIEAMSCANAASELLPSVLRVALESWSDYWAGLALRWLEAGYPSTGAASTEVVYDGPGSGRVVK
jgi:hypothetical protein